MSISVSHWTDFDTLTCAIDETLVCELSPDGQPLAALAQLRMQGFHGPIILQGLSPVLLQSPGFEWLASDLRQELGFYAPEEMPTARSLSAQGWRHSATVLYCFATRTLNHDFKHLLREWPERRFDLHRLWQRLQDKLGKLSQNLEPEIAPLTHLLYGSESRAEDIEAAWFRFWEALHRGQQRTVDPLVLARAIHSLHLHWPALIAARAACDASLSNLTEPSADLHAWLSRFNLRRLKQPQRVIEAAEQLKRLRMGFGAELQQHLHNTLEQHLYVVADLLQSWQRVTDFYYPDLQGLSFNQLLLWQERLPLPKPSRSTEGPVSTPGSAPKPYLLVLEDNLIWAEHMRQQIQHDALLSHYLKQYQWVSVNNLREAKTYLSRTAILIADLSMPLDAQEPPAREHGIAFLETHVGKTGKHAPIVIVHTTPTHFLQDHLALSQAGVLDADYVLKNEPSILLERLLKACERLTQPESYSLTLHPEHLVFNGTTLHLSPLNAHMLRALAESPATARQLLQRLIHQGYNEYQEDLDAPPESGQALHWEDLLHMLPASLAEAFGGMPENLQQALWTQLQHWVALVRSEAYVFDHPDKAGPILALGRQRLKDNLWLAEVQLLALLPTVLVQLMQGIQESDHPDALLRAKVSKMVSGLRQDIYAQCVAVQQVVNIRQFITRDAHQRYGLADRTILQQVDHQPVLTDPKTPRLWPVLLIEDDIAYAQEIQSLLSTLAQQHHLQLDCTAITHGGQDAEIHSSLQRLQEHQAAGGNPLPYLVLLDLHLPASADSAPDARTGYQLWKTLQTMFQSTLQPEQYQVLVTSTLTHEDNLRLEGIRLGIPLQQFIPKGETLHQLTWPESLHMAILRLLQEQRRGGKIAWEHISANPGAFPLQIEILDYRQKVLTLRVCLLSAPEQSYTTTHRHLHARWLLMLLQQPTVPISAESLMPPGECQRIKVNNLRNRLRNQLEKQWPLQLLQGPGERVVNALLSQQTLHRVPHFALQVAEVTNPKGIHV